MTHLIFLGSKITVDGDCSHENKRCLLLEAEAPGLWLPYGKKWLFGKDPDALKDWRQKEKGTAENEMVGWHHLLNGHEFEQTQRDSEGQGSLVCCSSWGSQKVWMTWQLNSKQPDCIKASRLMEPGIDLYTEKDPWATNVKESWSLEIWLRCLVPIIGTGRAQEC